MITTCNKTKSRGGGVAILSKEKKKRFKDFETCSLKKNQIIAVSTICIKQKLFLSAFYKLPSAKHKTFPEIFWPIFLN